MSWLSLTEGRTLLNTMGGQSLCGGQLIVICGFMFFPAKHHFLPIPSIELFYSDSVVDDTCFSISRES